MEAGQLNIYFNLIHAKILQIKPILLGLEVINLYLVPYF